MSRAITISDENFRRIQELAEPLVDTVDSVLSRVLDSYQGIRESSTGFESTVSAVVVPSGTLMVERTYEPFNPPDLTHTKVVFASVGGKLLESPNWNSVLDEVIRAAARELREFSDLKKLVRANIEEGHKTTDGYHPLSGTGLSVQGQSANDAWRYVAKIARQIGLRMQVQFFWREKEGAYRPGERGKFNIDGRG